MNIDKRNHVQELPTFQLVGLERPVTSTSPNTTQTNWKLCIICHDDKSEYLTSPSKSKRKDYRSGLDNFQEHFSCKDSMKGV